MIANAYCMLFRTIKCSEFGYNLCKTQIHRRVCFRSTERVHWGLSRVGKEVGREGSSQVGRERHCVGRLSMMVLLFTLPPSCSLPPCSFPSLPPCSLSPLPNAFSAPLPAVSLSRQPPPAHFPFPSFSVGVHLLLWSRPCVWR